jgi:hypothetical protein
VVLGAGVGAGARRLKLGANGALLGVAQGQAAVGLVAPSIVPGSSDHRWLRLPLNFDCARFDGNE